MNQDQINTAAKNFTKAVFQHESGMNYNAVGDAGTSHGAGQWQGGTWKAQAQDVLGNANAPMTPENQSIVAQGTFRKWFTPKEQGGLGLNAAQGAAKWNSGSENGWETKVGTTTINGKQIAYNVPQYVKSVTDLYQNFKLQSPEQGTQVAASTANPNQSNAGTSTQQPQSGGFFSDLINDPIKTLIAKPAARLGQAIAGVGVEMFGSEQTKQNFAKASQQDAVLPSFTGNMTIEGQKNFGQGGASQIAGDALKSASYLVPAERTAGAVSSIVKGKVAQAALGGATAGLIGGSLYGAGEGLQADNPNIGSVLGSTALGSVSGAATGGILGATIPAISNLFRKDLQSAIENTISKREQEIFNIENNYSGTRKNMSFSQDANAASRNRIAHTDVLVNSVDENGLIRTKQAGGAVDQYKAMTLDNAEQVVRNDLEREGSKVSLVNVAQKLEQEILDSGLEGSALKKALDNVPNEVEGLKLRADKDGNIPLVNLQDAKINTTNGINFMTEPNVKTAQKATARAYKQLIEKNSNLPIADINAELAKFLKDVELLKSLDGKKVKGGKLGKYFAQISGNIVGAMAGGVVGGPAGSALGTIVGGELAGKIKGSSLSKTLGKATGNVAEKSPIIESAIQRSNSPRPALPAPTSQFRSQKGSGPVINLPGKK